MQYVQIIEYYWKKWITKSDSNLLQCDTLTANSSSAGSDSPPPPTPIGLLTKKRNKETKYLEARGKYLSKIKSVTTN